MAEIDGFGAADGQYMNAGIRLLELTRNMHRLFEKQQAAEKRRLLNFVVSNSVWREGKIVPVWRQPFDVIAVANEPMECYSHSYGPEIGLNPKLAPRPRHLWNRREIIFNKLAFSVVCQYPLRFLERYHHARNKSGCVGQLRPGIRGGGDGDR